MCAGAGKNIRITFGEVAIPDETTLIVFPFESDVSRFVERTGVSLFGWRVVSLKNLIRRVFSEFFPEWHFLTPARRFAVVHRMVKNSDFLRDETAYLPATAGKIPVAESLVQFFAVLDEAGIFSPEDIPRIKDPDERTRAALEMYFAFREEIARNKLATAGDGFAMSARALSEGKVPTPLRGKKKVIFSNFLEFSVPQQGFVKALSKLLEVEINFPLPADFYPVRWRQLVENMAESFGIRVSLPEKGDGHWLSAALEGDLARAVEVLSRDDEIPPAAIARMPDPAREAEFAARISKLLAVAENVPPEEIFVITPDPDRYFPIIKAEFDRVGVPVQEGGVKNSPASLENLLNFLLDAHFSNWRRQETFSFLTHPIVAERIFEGSFTKNALRELMLRHRLYSLADWRSFSPEKALPEGTIDTAGAAAMAGIKQLIENLAGILNSSGRTLVEVLGEIGEAVALEKFVRDNAGVGAHIAAEWSQALDIAGELGAGYGEEEPGMTGGMLISALLHTFRPSQESGKVFSAGVRVIPVEEGRGNFAQAAFFVGFDSDRFPPKTGKNPILAQEYDEFLPFVPRRQEVAKLSLITGMMTARRSYLTAPLSDEERLSLAQPIDEIFRFCGAFEETPDGKRLIPDSRQLFDRLGRFVLSPIDEVLCEFEAEREKIRAGIDARLSGESAGVLRSGEEFFWRQRIFGDSVSVSEVEDFRLCQAAVYLRKVLGEMEPAELEETLSLADVGEAIHSALERFYREKYAEIGVELPQLHRYSPKNFESIGKLIAEIRPRFAELHEKIAVSEGNIERDVERLMELLREEFSREKLEEKNIPFTEADIAERLVIAGEESVRSILEKEMGIFPGRRRLPLLFETRVEGVVPTPDGAVRIRGKVDRIDLFEDDALLLIDYKTGRKILGGTSEIDSDDNRTRINWTVQDENSKLVEIQLNLYSLLFEQAGFAVRGAAYFANLREPGRPKVEIYEYNPGDVEKFAGWLSQIVSAMMSFDGTLFEWVGGKSCDYCEYKSICPFSGG